MAQLLRVSTEIVMACLDATAKDPAEMTDAEIDGTLAAHDPPREDPTP